MNTLPFSIFLAPDHPNNGIRPMTMIWIKQLKFEQQVNYEQPLLVDVEA